MHVTWGDKEDTDTQEGHIAEDTDTQEGQIASVKDGYKYQLPGWKGISPEPQLYPSTSPRLFTHLGFRLDFVICENISLF